MRYSGLQSFDAASIVVAGGMADGHSVHQASHGTLLGHTGSSCQCASYYAVLVTVTVARVRAFGLRFNSSAQCAQPPPLCSQWTNL